LIATTTLAAAKRGANNRAQVRNYLILQGFAIDGVKVGLESVGRFRTASRASTPMPSAVTTTTRIRSLRAALKVPLRVKA
jgi:hypothetical protein